MEELNSEARALRSELRELADVPGADDLYHLGLQLHPSDAKQAFVELSRRFFGLLGAGHPDLAQHFLAQACPDPRAQHLFRLAARRTLESDRHLQALATSF